MYLKEELAIIIGSIDYVDKLKYIVEPTPKWLYWSSQQAMESAYYLCYI